MPCSCPFTESLVAAMMSLAAIDPGGTTKSSALTALPAVVVMRILPEPVAAGTANASCVVVTDVAVAAC